jgi:hypothetical protein
MPNGHERDDEGETIIQDDHEVVSMIDVITTLVNLNKLALNDH